MDLRNTRTTILNQDDANDRQEEIRQYSLRKAFDVPKTLGIMPGRVTCAIHKEGIVRHMFNTSTVSD